MPPHDSPHPLAGRRTRVASGAFEGALVEVVDWYDRLNGGGSWRHSGIDPLAHRFAERVANARLPLDEDVVVVLIDGRCDLQTLLHVEELVPAKAVALLAWEGVADAAASIEGAP